MDADRRHKVSITGRYAVAAVADHDGAQSVRLSPADADVEALAASIELVDANPAIGFAVGGQYFVSFAIADSRKLKSGA